jgi:hypothetical protein
MSVPELQTWIEKNLATPSSQSAPPAKA